MSLDIPQPNSGNMPLSPLEQEGAAKFQDAAFERLAASGEVVLNLVPGRPFEINGPQDPDLGDTRHLGEGVLQELLTVLDLGGSGGEKVAIVRALVPGQTKFILNTLAKADGQRARFLKALNPGSKLELGRADGRVGKGRFSDRVSREHLKLTTTLEGRLLIQDEASLNGTRLIVPHEHGAFKSNDSLSWSADPDELRPHMQERQSPEPDFDDTQEIIVGVPGIVSEPRPITPDVQHSRNVPAPGFRGDPTRVPGSPHNPMSRIDTSKLFQGPGEPQPGGR